MAKKTKQEIIREATEKLMTMFQSGKMPEAIAWTLIQPKGSDERPCLNWSLGNQILMLSSKTMDARGYRQWLQVNRQVKKGAQAIWILAPLVKKIRNPKTGEEEPVVLGFKPVPVFKKEDTLGDPLPAQQEYEPESKPPLFEVAEKLGLEVHYEPFHADYLGSYSPSKDRIILSATDPIVLYHEMAHAVHHKFIGLDKSKRDEAEIIAEASAAVLCQIQGITGYESQAYFYLQKYTKNMKEDDVLQVMMKVLSDIERIVLEILNLAVT